MLSEYLVVTCHRDLDACLTLLRVARERGIELPIKVVWLEDSPIPASLPTNTLRYHELTEARLADVPDFGVASGWVLQQAIKLLYANHSTGDYVCLDSKDILLHDIASDGAGYVHKKFRIGDGQMRNYNAAAGSFGFTEPEFLSIPHIVDTITPFSIEKGEAIALMDTLNEQTRQPDFVKAFLQMRSTAVVTEFLLYYFFVMREHREGDRLVDANSRLFPAWRSPVVKVWNRPQLQRLAYDHVAGAALLAIPQLLREHVGTIVDPRARAVISALVAHPISA